MARRTPLFLAKSGYRSRRLSDASRVLPVLGMFLLILPALWAKEGAGPRSSSEVGVYIFGVWAGLICVAGLLARQLPKRDADDTARRERR